MKAMILAAGVGSRLGELTKDTPKCLVQVGGKAVLEHVVERLKSVGVTEVVINLHHLADKVVSFMESRHCFGLKVHFSREESLLDTGGGLKKAALFFQGDDAFFVHNADVLSTIDLAALALLHRSRSAIGTLAVLRRPATRGLYLDAANRLVGWSGEKAPAPTGTELFGFCGVSVASPQLFSFMPEESAFSLIQPYLAAARATKLVWGHPCPEAEWADIGTPEQLATARQKALR